MTNEFKLYSSDSDYRKDSMWFAVCLAQKMISYGFDSIPRDVANLAVTFIDSINLLDRRPNSDWRFWHNVADVLLCQDEDDLLSLKEWWKNRDRWISLDTYEQKQRKLGRIQ